MERLLRPEEVAAFASSLATHQRATLDDGSTVLDRAVIEHNMLATSCAASTSARVPPPEGNRGGGADGPACDRVPSRKLYANITLDQVGDGQSNARLCCESDTPPRRA